MNQTFINDIKEIIKTETTAIENLALEGNGLFEAVELLYKCIHENHGKLVVSGLGKAGQIGMNMATTFCSTGTTAVFLHPSEAQHGDLGILQKNDVLLLLSNSGETREILELTELSSKLYNKKFSTIVITGNRNSTLSRIADVLINTGSPKEVCPLGLTPTTSTTLMTVIGDILVVELMKKIGFTKEEYAKRHHGGYLGTVSRS